MTRKVCFKCKGEKSLDEFYRHKMMGDGHLGKCKECAKKDVRKHRRENESVQEYDRQRAKEPTRKALLAAGSERRKADHPEKYRANYAVGNAVRDGRLDKPDRCSRCNEKGRRIEGHHEDYSKPLEVIWLCTLCHRRHT